MIGHEVNGEELDGEYVVGRERTSVEKLSARCAGIDIPACGRGGGLLGFSAEGGDLEELDVVECGFYERLSVGVGGSQVKGGRSGLEVAEGEKGG